MLHGTHVKSIEIDASVDAVLATIARPDLWVRLPGGEAATLDFRVGGEFRVSGTFHIPDRPTERLDVRYRYLAIGHPDVLYSYELLLDGALLSASLVTMTVGDGVLTLTEQYAFLDRDDAATAAKEREGSTRLMLNGLKAVAEARSDHAR